MAITNRITTGGTVGGISMSGQATRSTTSQVGYDGPLAVAWAGTLTYVSATSGTIAVVTGHGIATGDKFDIYWTIAGVNYCAYGAVAGVVGAPPADTSIPFTASSGNAIPNIAPFAVTIREQIVLDIDFDADLMKAYGVICSGIGHVKFLAGTVVKLALYLPTNECQSWMSDQGITNPMAGFVITSVTASQASTSAIQTLRIGVGKNA